MFVYWIFFAILTLTSIVFPSFSNKKDYNVTYYLAVVFVLIVLASFAGLRFASNDYDGYVQIYKAVPPLGEINSDWIQSQDLNVEVGFIYLCSFLKLFSSNPVLLFLTVATISVGLNVIAIRKLSPYIFLSILIYFVYNFLLKETIQIRQGLASALIMFSFLFSKNRLKASFFILIACMIQSTAWVAFLVLFFSRLNFKETKTYYYILAATFLAAVIYSGRHLFEFLLGVMNLPASLTAYFGWEEFDYDLGFLNPVLVKQIFVCVVLLINRVELQKRYPQFIVIFNYYFISSLWYIYFNDFAIIAGRISNLLSVGEVILIPMLLSVLPKKHKLTAFAIIIIYCALLLFLNLKGGQIFPYKTIF